MIFCNAHISMSCSAIIRDAVSYSRWEQIETHVIQKVRGLEILGPKQDVSIKFLLPWFREPHITLLYYNDLLCAMRNMFWEYNLVTEIGVTDPKLTSGILLL